MYLERLRQMEEKEMEKLAEANQKTIQVVYHITQKESSSETKTSEKTNEIK